MYFDQEGNPLGLMEWAKLFGDRDYSIIKQTRHKEKGREFWLSTVWLGADHSFGHGGRKLIFETMALEFIPQKANSVVADVEDWFWQERYSTKAEAISYHDPWRVVNTYKPDILKLFIEALSGKEGNENDDRSVFRLWAVARYRSLRRKVVGTLLSARRWWEKVYRATRLHR